MRRGITKGKVDPEQRKLQRSIEKKRKQNGPDNSVFMITKIRKVLHNYTLRL